MIARKIALFISLACLMLPESALSELPFTLPPRNEILKIRSAIVATSQGEFLVELFPDAAPVHVANFKFLADKGTYNNTRFHLYQEGYIIQGGDPTGTGDGGPGYNLPPEFSSLPHKTGTVGMSRRSDDINPQRVSSGSQFHILLNDAPHMDKKYTVFGRVIDGMSVVEKLRKGDTIYGVRVYVKNPEPAQRSGESR